MIEKVSFVARVKNIPGDEYKQVALLVFDKESQNYTVMGAGRSSPQDRSIAFIKVAEEFKDGDLVKITFKKQKERVAK